MQNQRRQLILPGALLAAAVFAVFAQLGRYDFVEYDDPDYVTENSIVRRGLSGEGLRWAFTTDHMGHWHPLTWISHMLDVEMFGVAAGPHHLVNVGFHLANTLLLFGLLANVTRQIWPSFAAAALFGIHPLRAESVAWIAERKDVLSTLLWLLTMATYVRWTRSRALAWYGATLACLTLGLMAKPMLVTLPFALVLFDVWPLRRLELPRLGVMRPAAPSRRGAPLPQPDAAAPTALLAEKAPMLALVAAISVVAYMTQASSGAVAKLGDIPMSIRLTNAVVAYASYLGKVLWPANLAVLYPYRLDLPAWQAIAAGLTLAAITFLAVRAAARHPYALVGWLWYLGTLVPVIGLIQIGDQSMADRYTYIPSIGIFVAAAWLGSAAIAHYRIPTRIAAAAIAAVISIYSAVAWRQVGRWQDGATLLAHTAAVTRRNHVALTNLGAVLADRARYDEAVEQLERALSYKPDYSTAIHNLGMIYWQRGDSDKAIAYYRKALAIDPNAAGTLSNLGLALTLLGHPEEALVELEAAIRLHPEDSRAHNNLGVALRALGRTDEAMEHFHEAMRLRHDYADPYNNIGGILSADGRFEEAEENFRTALRLSPGLVEGHFNLGRLLLHRGRAEESVNHLTEAARLDPHGPERRQWLGDALRAAGRAGEAAQHYRAILTADRHNSGAHYGLALALTESGNPEEALEHFDAALRSNPDNAQMHNDLGVALFALGRTAEAVDQFERALRLDPMLADARTNLEFTGRNPPPPTPPAPATQ